MTKKVRIENADTSSHPVRITGQRKNADGVWVDDETSPVVQIDYPTQQAEQFIHSGRRLVIEELPPAA